jgi:formiminotetrahydrofolate cyclodeaminase
VGEARRDRLLGEEREADELAARDEGREQLLGSVVAKKSFTCGGGSSSVFRKALTASFVSMCVSSTM